MARQNTRNTSSKRGPKIDPRKVKKKACQLCKDGVEWVDYKDVALLRRHMSDRGKIRGQRVSGNCTQHQNDIAVAIKTARELALLPYTQRTVTERPGGRRGDRRGGGRRFEDRDEAKAEGGDETAESAGAVEGAEAPADVEVAEVAETVEGGEA